MDLLGKTGGQLVIRENVNNGVYVEGLVEEFVTNAEETIELLRKGF